jgi:hypothetical protein
MARAMDERHAREAEAALARARELLSRAGPLEEKAREDALAALSDLSRALEPALRAAPADARLIGHFAEAAAHEATRARPSRSILGKALGGLDAAIERLETSYPTLAGMAERVSDALGKIGI